MSKLIEKTKIAIALYARFPTEMAYGNHVIQIAKAFTKNNCEVNIYYPETYNSKTLDVSPEVFYGVLENVKYIMVKNRDITSYKIYDLLPKVLRKLFFSLNTLIWSRKLRKNNNEQFLWSTNPNILSVAQKFFTNIIYEKHGEAKYIQKISISRLKKNKNALLIGVTKESFKQLSKNFNKTLYLPNGVDEELFSPKQTTNCEEITIGYLGMLETYGVDKGVLDAVVKIEELNSQYSINTKIIGGPKNKLNEIKTFVSNSRYKNKYYIDDFISHKDVPIFISQFDIGIVPYPDSKHMSMYASPMKIFEMAACGVPILASNIQSHMELDDLNLGIIYFEHGNFLDFSNKLEMLITSESLRKELSNKSIENIKNLFWKIRIEKILSSARSSTG